MVPKTATGLKEHISKRNMNHTFHSVYSRTKIAIEERSNRRGVLGYFFDDKEDDNHNDHDQNKLHDHIYVRLRLNTRWIRQ
jgi:hypothetical protein